MRAFFSTNGDQVLSVRLELAHSFELLISSETSTSLQLEIEKWFESYLNQKHYSLFEHLKFEKSTSFQAQGYKTLSQIEFGATWSYQKLAEMTGHRNASRAVGTLCRQNSFPLILPCHRVICKNGQTGNYNGGIELKKRLLQFEEALA